LTCLSPRVFGVLGQNISRYVFIGAIITARLEGVISRDFPQKPPSHVATSAMTEPDTPTLWNHALSLPDSERAALAAVLLESLDESPDPDAEALWAEEILRRKQAWDRGEVTPVPWTMLRAKLLGEGNESAEY
jgi:hypothetical protein